MRPLISFSICFLMLSAQCQRPGAQSPIMERIKGLSFVAPSRPFDSNPFVDVLNVNSSWIAVIPYAFCRAGEPVVHYDHQESDQRWWGEGRHGIEETICQAQSNHIKVMLKPQIWVGKDWIGNLQFATAKDWEKWEDSYEDYILPFATLSEEMGVEMICIGTEIKGSITARPQFWQNLITKVRSVYKGKVTYAANWDEYEKVSFWSRLDYIGVNAYFPLCEEKNPTEQSLTRAWDPLLNELGKFSKKYHKPILFTEYGYLSVDGSGGKTWELESKLKSLDYNPQAQANCLNALLECCSKRDFWQGGFVWKWYSDPKNMRHGLEKDHSPQGKPAEDVIRKWYAKM